MRYIILILFFASVMLHIVRDVGLPRDNSTLTFEQLSHYEGWVFYVYTDKEGHCQVGVQNRDVSRTINIRKEDGGISGKELKKLCRRVEVGSDLSQFKQDIAAD